MPPEKPRFYGIQILRGIAAMLVLFHHQMLVALDHIPATPYLHFFDNGAMGVDLFFPISGFVMFLTASSLLRRKASGPAIAREFIWRRVVRVVPVYWILTTLKLLAFVIAPAFFLHFTLRPWNVIGSYFFLPAFDHNLQPEPVIPVGWTLNAEMMFYAILALALALRAPLLRFIATFIVTLAVIGFFVPQAANHPWQAFLIWTDPVSLEFVAGMIFGAMLSRIRAVPLWLIAPLAGAGLIFALLVSVGPIFTFSPWRPLIWGVPGALIVWATLALEPVMRLHKQRALLLLGDASYSLYLVQTFLLPFVGFALKPLHLHGAVGLLLFLLLSTPVVLAISIVFHLYVELPLLRALSRWSPPWSTHSAEMV